MKKFYKIMGIIAGCLLLTGGIFVGVGSITGAETSFQLFGRFQVNFGSNEEHVQKTTQVEAFTGIDLDVNMGDVILQHGEDYGVAYTLYSDNVEYYVEDGVLHFEERSEDGFFNFNFFNFNWNHSEVIIYVPDSVDSLDQVSLNSDMGDIEVKELTIDSLDAYSDMGSVDLDQVTVGDLMIGTDMGNLTASGVFLKSIDADNNMGDITFEGYLACDTDASTDMGDVEITTYYDKNSYDYELNTDMGDDQVQNKGGDQLSGNERRMILSSNMGDVTLTFTEAK